MLHIRQTFFLLLLTWGPLLSAQTPELGRVSPRAARPGETVTVTFTGNNLLNPAQIWTSFGANVQWVEKSPTSKGASEKGDPRKLVGKMTLPLDAPLGTGVLRVPTATGMSGALFFVVDEIPVVAKSGQNGSASTAQKLAVPAAVEGNAEAGRSDFYRLELKAGESVSAEVFANRIGSKMDPWVRLLDARGRELLMVDDTPGLAGDCRFRYRTEVGEVLIVEVRDVSFSGSADHFYHLRFGDFPLVSGLFPPAGAPGKATRVEAIGESVEGVPAIEVVASSSVNVETSVPVRFSPQKPPAFARFRTEVSMMHFQKEAEDKTVKEVPEACCLSVFGKIDGETRRNTFLLSAKKDETVRLTPLTRSIGSPAVLYLGIADERGTFVAGNDIAGNGTSNETELKFRAPSDGTYKVTVEDVARRGGGVFVYGIILERDAQEFELSSSSERFIAPRGGTFTAKVTAQRKNVSGPITLELLSGGTEPLPAEFRVEQNVIENGKNETLLKVTAPEHVPSGTLYHIKIIGHAEVKGRKIRATVSAPKVDPNKPLTDSFLAALQSMPQPPRLLCETFPLCVGPEAPDFFSIQLTDAVVNLPTVIGKNQFILRQTALDLKFEGNAQFKFEGLPEGVSIRSESGRGGRIKGQVDFICEVSGPADLPLAAHSFDIVATAEHKGVQKDVRLKKVALQVVKPLSIAGSLEAALVPGRKQVFKITALRYGTMDPQSVDVTLSHFPEGVTGPAKITLAPGQTEAVVELEACEATAEGDYQTMRLNAQTRVNGIEIDVESAPIRLEVKK
ncbi:MAG: hypothetical protein DVB28_001600 [Verrucomicrobia bacterium]|nr:MAG: hypothetical protein DVB28_001600 [Verrucomicrobiota bacterium]